VEAVGDLDRVWCADPASFGVAAGAVAADHFGAGVLAQLDTFRDQGPDREPWLRHLMGGNPAAMRVLRYGSRSAPDGPPVGRCNRGPGRPCLPPFARGCGRVVVRGRQLRNGRAKSDRCRGARACSSCARHVVGRDGGGARFACVDGGRRYGDVPVARSCCVCPRRRTNRETPRTANSAHRKLRAPQHSAHRNTPRTATPHNSRRRAICDPRVATPRPRTPRPRTPRPRTPRPRTPRREREPYPRNVMATGFRGSDTAREPGGNPDPGTSVVGEGTGEAVG
jgi:hypothetical protein